MKTLAVIPARGGSKRIPGKNIKSFCGKPMIAYSIQAALDSGLFDKVLVSTDSEQIAQVAEQHGAEVPFMRPASLSDDVTGTTPVVCHAIDYCKQHFFTPEFSCCIYATAPFLSAEALRSGFEQLQADVRLAFTFSATSFAFPIQRAIRLKNPGVEPINPENMAKRSQDLEEAYHDAGQFYWARGDAFHSDKGMFSAHSGAVFLPRHQVQDIDTPEDWQRAELMYQAYMRQH